MKQSNKTENYFQRIGVRESGMINIAINALNVKTRDEISRINKIIENFGVVAADKLFLLIARKSQEDLYIAAPANFEYFFYGHPAQNGYQHTSSIEGYLKSALADLGCDLMFEIEGSISLDLGCPGVSLLNNADMFGSGYRANDRTHKRGKLTLIKKPLIESKSKSDDAILPSQYILRFHL